MLRTATGVRCGRPAGAVHPCIFGSLVQDVAHAGGRAFPGEPGGAAEAGLAEAPAQLVVAQAAAQARGNRVGVARVHPDGGVAHGLREGGRVGHQGGRAAGHRLQRGQAKSLGQRREDQEVGQGVERGQIGIGHVAGEEHLIRHAAVFQRVADGVHSPGGRAGQHQPVRQPFPPDGRERLQQPRQVLLGFQVAQVEKEVLRQVEARAHRAQDRGVGDGMERRVHAQRHHDHLVGRDAAVLHDLGAHVRGGHHHSGCPAHRARQHHAVVPGIGARGQFRVCERDEVIDDEHTGAGPAEGHHVAGGEEDVRPVAAEDSGETELLPLDARQLALTGEWGAAHAKAALLQGAGVAI